MFHRKTIYIDSFPHFSVFGSTQKKKNSQRKTIFSQWKTLIKTRLIFYGMFSKKNFWKAISLSRITSPINIIFFSLPSVTAGNNYFGAFVSQSHSKLSVFSLLFAFSLLSYSHCLSPSGLSSFQFSQISLYLSLTVNNSSLHW